LTQRQVRPFCDLSSGLPSVEPYRIPEIVVKELDGRLLAGGNGILIEPPESENESGIIWVDPIRNLKNFVS